MPKLDPALWRDMMTYLRDRHAPICRQWFEELRPVSLESGLLKVSTNSPVQQNYLQKKCLDQFTEAAQAATKALIAVRFVHDSSELLEEEADGSAGVGATVAANTLNGTVGSATGLLRSTPMSQPLSPSFDQGVGGATINVPRSLPVPQPGSASPPPALPNRTMTSAGITAAAMSVVRPTPALSTYAADPVMTEQVFEQPVISPDYAFENFVRGPGNQLAYAAAVAVADQPGIAYNPLFIHGGVGLGKTHLLQAICQTILQRNPTLKICYLSCDAFINQFLHCVQKGIMDQFRHRYRHVDVLVIDDIHFLGMGNRERTQEEFFHTFNQLHQSRKQIVLSSDAAPTEIPSLEDRLLSRFQWGLVAHIAKPDYETRMAIVQSKTQLRGLMLPEDVISYIATRIDSNARELEGAINTIQAMAMLQGKTIDLPLAQKALGEPGASGRNGQVTLQQIVDAVTAFYNVKLSDLQSKRRHKSITMPRQVCMWLARKRTRFSLQEIGAFFGGRDHTTVMHSIQMVEDRHKADASFAKQVEQIDVQITHPAAM